MAEPSQAQVKKSPVTNQHKKPGGSQEVLSIW